MGLTTSTRRSTQIGLRIYTDARPHHHRDNCNWSFGARRGRLAGFRREAAVTDKNLLFWPAHVLDAARVKVLSSSLRSPRLSGGFCCGSFQGFPVRGCAAPPPLSPANVPPPGDYSVPLWPSGCGGTLFKRFLGQQNLWVDSGSGSFPRV